MSFFSYWFGATSVFSSVWAAAAEGMKREKGEHTNHDPLFHAAITLHTFHRFLLCVQPSTG